jgi:hypothetical protein
MFTSLLSGEYPSTELSSTGNSTIAPCLLILPCRARFNCQPTTSFHFTQLNATHPAWGPCYIVSGRTQQNILFFYCCARVPFRGNVFTEPLPRNGLHKVVVLLVRALPSNGRCLQSSRLAKGVYAIILSFHLLLGLPICLFPFGFPR